MLSPAHRSPLFPYTTLFRSLAEFHRFVEDGGVRGDRLHDFDQLHQWHGIEEVQSDEALGTFRRGSQLGHTYRGDRKSTRLNSSHVSISYAVFCLKKKTFKAQ